MQIMRHRCTRRKCRARRQRVPTMPRMLRAPSRNVEAIYEFACVTRGTSLSSGFFSGAPVGTTPAPERAERCNEMHSFNKQIGQGGDMKLTRAVVAIGCALFLSCAAVFTAPAPAAAVATLYLSDGINPAVTIVDGGLGDMNPAAGVVTFIGAIGVWTVNVSTGISNSPFPHIDLNIIDMSSGAGTSTLTIKFGDTDFSLGAGPHTVSLGSAIGGTTDGSVTWQA